MAAPRVARCPHCQHERETRAQPRTRLRCPECKGHYLAPPISPGEDQPPDAGPLDAAGDPTPDAEVVRLDTLSFPTAPVAPTAAAGQTPPEPAGPPPEPAGPAADPDPDPPPEPDPDPAPEPDLAPPADSSPATRPAAPSSPSRPIGPAGRGRWWPRGGRR